MGSGFFDFNILDAVAAMLMVGGLIFLVIGFLQWVYVACDKHFLWGMLCVFFPPAGIIFILKHWRETSGCVFLMMLGLASLGGGWDAAHRAKGRSLLVVNRIERIVNIDPPEKLDLPFSFGGIVEKVSSKGPLTLSEAVRKGDLMGVRKAVFAGGDPNEVIGEGGWTPLMEASSYGYEEIVRFLVKHGAFAGARNEEGKSAVDLARENGRADIVRILRGEG